MAAGSRARAAGTIRVDGLRRLRRDLKAAGDDLGDLKDANAKVAQLVAIGAAARAPHKSGKLAASGRGNRAVGKATVTFGGARVPYAGPVHWGWPAHHIEPHTFIPDAAQQLEPVWLQLYQDDLEQALAPLQGTTY